MPLLTLNDVAVLAATVLFPRVGVWTCDLSLDSAAAPTTAVTLAVADGPTWVGSVVAGAVVNGTWQGTIVGGWGGLRAPLGPLAYHDATLADVLADALREAAESLASDADDLSAAVARWHRHGARPAAQTVADVATAAGYAWRVRGDGRVWMGAETWPDAIGDLDDIDLLRRDPTRDVYDLAGDTLAIAPGTTLLVSDEGNMRGVLIDTVRHQIEASAVTTTVWEYRA